MSEAKWLGMMGVESLSIVEIDDGALRLHIDTVWGTVRASGPSVQEAVLAGLRAILKNAEESVGKVYDPDLRASYQARAVKVGALLDEAAARGGT